MTTISQQPDDIFTIRAPDNKEGDIIEISDVEDNIHRVRLTMPMGNEFNFVWADPAPQAEESTGGSFIKQGNEWLIKTNAPHQPGDKITVNSSNGTQEQVLGQVAGENLFHLPNHFVRNPAGENAKPKWCARIYDANAKKGDIVKVAKKGDSSQRLMLQEEVQAGIWTTKAVK